jgi:hypothetical protein
VDDATLLAELLHVHGDQAYRGQRGPSAAKDFTNLRYRHCGMVDEAERIARVWGPRQGFGIGCCVPDG